MTGKQHFMTLEGKINLEKELDYLKSVKRQEVSERIKIAKGFGDLSENSEYDEAKNEQAQVEERIYKLENIIANAKVIDDKEVTLDKISVGSKVTLMNLKYEEEEEYAIVGTTEADPFEAKISNESPLGQALLGKEKGQKVEIQVPDGVVQYEILEISR